MKINIVIAGIFLLLISLFFSSPVFAGGGNVFVQPVGNPNQWTAESKMYQVFVHLHPNLPCSGAKITFDFVNKEDGDTIITGADSNTYTMNRSETRLVNGKSIYVCSTYAKYFSTKNNPKIALITVNTTNGQTLSNQVALNFQLNQPTGSSDYLLPWDNQDDSNMVNLQAPQIEITDASQLSNKNTVRAVKFRIHLVSGANLVNIWAKAADEENYYSSSSGGITSTDIAYAYVNPNKNYYFKAKVCADKSCSGFGNEVFLDVTKLVMPAFALTPTVVSKNNSQAEISSTPNKNDSDQKVEQLTEKVENLQNQLVVSQKKQSALESRFNQLVNWIKSVFPFFK